MKNRFSRYKSYKLKVTAPCNCVADTERGKVGGRVGFYVTCSVPRRDVHGTEHWDRGWAKKKGDTYAMAKKLCKGILKKRHKA